MLDFFQIALTLHVVCCSIMVGIIWLVQLDVYPMLTKVGEKEFEIIHQFHMNKISLVVAPVMFLELVTAVAIFYLSNHRIFLFNLMGVIGLWIWTFFANIPSHNKLSYQSLGSKRSLVLLNWPRTIMWSLRLTLLLSYFLRANLTS